MFQLLQFQLFYELTPQKTLTPTSLLQFTTTTEDLALVQILSLANIKQTYTALIDVNGCVPGCWLTQGWYSLMRRNMLNGTA